LKQVTPAMAVNCLQASPLGKGLFRAAIGESGASFRRMLNNGSLAEAEERGTKFAASVGAKSIAELRARPAVELVKAAFSPGPNTDGWVLPEDPLTIFESGKQNRVPVLVGSNSDEGRLFERGTVTAQQYVEAARARFGAAADEYLKLYPAGSDAQSTESRQRAATVERMGLNARLWASAVTKSGSKAYIYYFTRITPSAPDAPSNGIELGAPHGEDLGYVFNNLGKPANYKPSNTFRDAQPVEYDLKLAGIVSSYWVNFAKTLDPNGSALPHWTAFEATRPGMVMELGDQVGMRVHPDDAGTVFLAKHPPVTAP
jgi:para-nitrobenzyl esterase